MNRTEKRYNLRFIGIQDVFRITHIKQHYTAFFNDKTGGRHHFLEIHYLYSGKGSFIINNKIYTMKGGDVLFIGPGICHKHFRSVVDVSQWYLIHVDFDSVNTSFLGYTGDKGRRLREGLKKIDHCLLHVDRQVKDTLDDIIDVYNSDDELKKYYIQKKMSDLLLKLIELYKKQPGRKRMSNEIVSVINYIKGNTENEISIKDILEKFKITESKFYRKFKHEVGMTPIEYILHNKIQRAEELLKIKEKKIIEVAVALGFPTSQYFASVFKKYTGITPREYKRLKK